jgi:hypothetical protein
MAALLAASGVFVLGAPAAGASGSNTLTVTAGEYAYQLKGKPKAGWVQINFDNLGSESHMMQMARLKPGVTAAQVKKAVLSNDPNAGKALTVGDGNVAPTPGVLGPGMKSGIILKLAAGHYAMFCFIPAVTDHQPHVAHGMIKTFDIAKGKSSLTPPTDGVVKVDVTDSSTTIPATLPARGYAKFTNTGTTNRSLGTAVLQSGVTPAQADAYFQTLFSGGTLPTGTPPAVLTGGYQSLPIGGSVYLVLQFAKGSYAYSNSNPDLSNGDPNPDLGAFTVK